MSENFRGIQYLSVSKQNFNMAERGNFVGNSSSAGSTSRIDSVEVDGLVSSNICFQRFLPRYSLNHSSLVKTTIPCLLPFNTCQVIFKNSLKI